MAVLSDVTSGTISVANGSTAVTGVGTAWQIQGFREGDLILKDNYSGVIASVNSDTSITLVDGWVGTSLVAAPYRIRYAADGERVTAKAQQLIDSLTNGMLGQIYDLVPEPNTVIGFDASGIGELFPIFDLIQGVQVDAKVEDLAGRAAYDGNAAGFSVLVADVGDGRSAIYFKNSNTSGDWSDPAYLTGENGSFQSEGDWSNAVTYNQGQVVYYQGSSWISVQNAPNLNHAPPTLPTTSNAWWTILARAASGFTFRGVYSGATAYVKDDVVTDQNASWIALQATTGNAPPALPTTVNANWQLIVLGSGAFKGDYAAGTQYVYGDIVFNQNSSWVAKIATIGNAPPTLPTTSNTQWQAVALGKNGTFRGDYAGGTAYIIGDTVLYNNSTWQAIAATTGNTPPALPATVNTWWQLVAAKGTGDVNGPASSVAANLPVFLDATGKTLADSKVSIRLSNLRNYIMNPEFFVVQRGSVVTNPINGGYGPDRWRIAWNGTGSARTLSRAQMAPGHTTIPGNPAFACRINQTTAGTGMTVNDFRHDMESVKWSSGLTYTLTFYMWATGTPTIPLVYLLQNFGTGGSPSTAVSVVTPLANFVLNNGVPTKYQAVVTIPSIDGKTLGSNGDDSLQLRFSLPLNATFDVYLTRVSFVEGDVTGIDDPFVPRPMGDEFLDCMRFYESSNNRLACNVTSGSAYNIWQHFKVPKRFVPTVILTNASNVNFPATTGLGAATQSGFNETRTANGTGPGGYASVYTADCDW